MVHRLGATAGGDPLSVGVHRKPARADLLSPLWSRRCRPQPLSRRRPYRRGPHLEARPVTRPSALPPFTTAASLAGVAHRSEEHTSELQSLIRISYAVFCLNKKKNKHQQKNHKHEATEY